MWVFADLADDELAYYATLPCACHTATRGGTRYTCAAHRAQAELDRRAELVAGREETGGG